MTDYRAVDPTTDKLFEATLQKVEDQLEIKRKDVNAGLKLLSRFEELKNYRSLFVHKVTELKGKSGSFIILLVEKHLTIIEQKRRARVEKEIEEIEPILIFSIPQDIGRACIRKETLADKVADLFTKVDIDFEEYPGFSKNYLFVGEKPDEVKRHLPRRLLESLNKVEDMIVEINGNWGLLRTEKNLTEDVLLLLISIGYKMTK
jgi:hypothetical protein